MKLFNLFRSKENNESVDNLIQKQLDYLPEVYHSHRQYKNCIEFLENREWALALDSLIELSEETGHYFSNEFWNSLLEVAKRMNLSNEEEYFLDQLKRNQSDLEHRIPFGWAEVKHDENLYETHTSEKNVQHWNSERRIKDNIVTLTKVNGVYRQSSGRCGIIYIVEDGNLSEISYELEMNAAALFVSTLKWVLPVEKIDVRGRKRRD